MQAGRTPAPRVPKGHQEGVGQAALPTGAFQDCLGKRAEGLVQTTQPCGHSGPSGCVAERDG